MNIFVYGSLQRGQSNHAALGSSTFVTVAAVVGLDLYDLGAFPMVLPGRGTVHGEVYDVSAATLERLDVLEGHPSHYRRTAMTTTDGLAVEVYVYQRPAGRSIGRYLPDGVWPDGFYYDWRGQPTTADAWGLAFTRDRTVARTIVREPVTVSTVWLGIDHNFSGDGPPLIFETMVFGGGNDGAQYRYATEAEALAGHARVVAELS